MLKLYKILIVFLAISNAAMAQEKIAYGLSGMYNFPVKTTGVGLRVQYPVKNWLVIAPQIKYVPNFNAIHEIYGGVHAHLLLLSRTKKISYYRSAVEPQKPNLYITLGVDYNHWFNYIPSMMSRAKENNILPKVGIGTAIGSHKFRFFAEAKYNIIWNESYAEAGLLFYPAYKNLNLKNRCSSKR